MDPGELNDDLLPTILELCEEFFASTSPAVRQELDTLLRAHDITGGPGWLIDMLAFTRMRLPNAVSQPPTAGEVRSKLAEIDQRSNRSMESELTSRWCR